MANSVIAHLFHSVNGVVQDPHLFQFGLFGPEDGAAMGRSLAGVTDVVMGATLWREWSEYWPTADDEFGAFINPARKHVISSTLQGDLPWNSTLVTGDPVDYVRELKATAEGHITVAGGVQTVRSLFLAGVVDSLTLTTHPVVAEGERLFGDDVNTTRLELIDHEITPLGNVRTTYRLAASDQ